MKKAIVIGIGLLLLSGAATWASLATAIQDGADRVADLQAADGKWGWPLTAPPTYTNIVGPIGLGQLAAYGVTADADHLASAVAAADTLTSYTHTWVGTYNPMFLVKAYDATGTAAYMTQAQTFYSQLSAGTYVRNSVAYSTASFITLIQNGRAGTWQNLLPWEYAPLAYGASRAGDSSQVDAFVQAIKDGVNTLDNQKTVDLLGLAGGVMGLSLLGEEFDPTSGAFASADSVKEMADLLASYQNSNGAWYWSSTVTAGDDNEDMQVTAYAMLALDAANSDGSYDDEILLARAYLLSYQQTNGGWPSYPTGGENVEVDGEIVWALAQTAQVPEPATMLLLGSGLMTLAGVVRRKRK